MSSAAIIYIMGVSGSGKSTIGQALASALEIPFFDGDDFHPEANIQKMAAGQPLEDEDRWGWLKAIQSFVTQKLDAGRSLVVATSALKGSYRQVLSNNISDHQIQWVFLKGSYDLILSRLQNRTGHFMPPQLLQSQFDTLEMPENAIQVDIGQTIDEIILQLKTQLAK